MRERPILMSAPMVRAILDGRKTQTRRVVKVQGDDRVQEIKFENGWLMMRVAGRGWAMDQRCQYGEPGQRLWVREAWRADAQHDALAPRDIPPGPYFCEASRCNWEGGPYDGKPGKLRPGIFMPRWASRITLEISEVRVQRLQEISEADAIAEGCKAEPPQAPYRDCCGELVLPHERTARLAYCELWDSINGASLRKSINGADSWNANPWVWVVAFKRVPP